MFPPFRPHPLIRGGHAQTIFGCYLPVPKWIERAARHEVMLPDGDRLVLHDDRPGAKSECHGPKGEHNGHGRWHDGERVALLVHGLGGCHRSHYMQRTTAKLMARGVRVFRMDLRGCGAGATVARLPVHAGRSEDIAAALSYVIETCPNSPVYLVGYSMAGNMILKLLGELGGQVPANLAGAMAIAPPIDLLACARNMERGWNRLYNKAFLRSLLQAAAIRRKHVPREYDPPLNPLPRRLWEFDDRFTAPLGGFTSAEDYYLRVSSGPVLKEISVPTVVLTAADDPIVPVTPFETATYSSSMTLVIAPSGGHVGFVGARGVDPDRRWLDWRVVDWVLSGPAHHRRESHMAGRPFKAVLTHA